MGPIVFTALIFFGLGFGTATFIGLVIAVRDEQYVRPEDNIRCFPVVEGVISVSIQADPWVGKECSSNCTDSGNTSDCFCFMLITMDKKETVKFPIEKPSIGGKSTHEISFRRFRQYPFKELYIHTNERTSIFDIAPFNSDLVSENRLCETIVRPNGEDVDRCTKIILQKVKERGLKARSCARRDWLGMWDIDDLS